MFEMAIKLLDQKVADLLSYNLRASQFPCPTTDYDIKINNVVIEDLKQAIEKLKKVELSRLQQQNKELIEALKPFALRHISQSNICLPFCFDHFKKAAEVYKKVNDEEKI